MAVLRERCITTFVNSVLTLRLDTYKTRSAKTSILRTLLRRDDDGDSTGDANHPSANEEHDWNTTMEESTPAELLRGGEGAEETSN